MPAFRDRTDERYGSLIALRYEIRERTWWFCKCDCGSSLWVLGANLHFGKNHGTRSCGCSKDGHPTHGQSGTPEYKAWKALRQRCTNPNETGYKHYGGRGIRVCRRWDSFENFLEDMGPRPSPKHSIERMNVNSNYTPSNCCWATVTRQRRNRTDSVLLTFQGKTLQLCDWADLLGISITTLRGRYYKNLPIERVLQVGRLRRAP